MGLFSRKPKVGVAEFSRSLYDEHVFRCLDDGTELSKVFAEATHRLIVRAEERFGKVSVSDLNHELIAVRLEIIGCAITHNSSIDIAMEQSEFTKEYLDGCDWPGGWDCIVAANKVVSQSATYGLDKNNSTVRARIVALNKMKMDLFDKWHGGRISDEAIARVANRLGTDKSCIYQRTAPLIGIHLQGSLGIEFSETVAERLAAVTVGFYEGALEFLSGKRLTIA